MITIQRVVQLLLVLPSRVTRANRFISTLLMAGVLLGMSLPTLADTVIVAEDFVDALNATTAETFDADIVTAGGSATWVADSSTFTANGNVVASGRNAAYLNLGSYINDAKGTTAGKFELTMTISETTGTDWISLGFDTSNTPSTANDFATGNGMATIVRRITDELDMFIGPKTGGSTDGPDNNLGNRTLTVALDFTPAGGYDGSSNYGTVTWTDSALGAVNNLGTPFALPDQSFGSILISDGGTPGANGTISGLTLTQIGELGPAEPRMRVYHGATVINVGATNALPTVETDVVSQREYTTANLASATTNLYLTSDPVVVFSESGTASYNGFTITTNVSNTATNLAAGESQPFTIQSVQSVAGTYSATVSIANSDTNRNPYTFVVTAKAMEPFVVGPGTIIYHDFTDGGAGPINGTAIDLIDASVTAVNGGVSTWSPATATFLENGSHGAVGHANMHIPFGEYINSTKGNADGQFEFTATGFDGPSSGWTSITLEDGPAAPNGNFTDYSGLANLTREFDSTSRGWSGPATANSMGFDTATGDTLTIQLDLTPAGGYDGATNFGTVKMFNGTSATTALGSYTYTSATDFEYVVIGTSGPSAQIDGLTVTQIGEISPAGTMIFVR